ncbi:MULTISPECIES: DNA repair protein RecO [unclassified Empedobacter]|uniref:DNA repair protein RecO n=1 Tax=Empedobacter TaxID=59734 RepID=UPI0025C63B44|nr:MULTISPECIES: DNA repair protein RecO [unclassified Empedobacter]
MKILETKAIVLSSLKYGDTSLIIRCYTQDFGLKSFIAKGVFSKKKRNTSLYFPLAEIDLSFQPKSNEQQLVFLKSVQTSYYYESLHFHPIKSAIVFFLAEILNLVLKEEADNPELYFYIEHSLKEFDQKKDDFADFHLIFLIQLSHFLGFYPNLETDGNLFDLENGFFTNSNSSINMLKADETVLFKKLLELHFSEDSKNTFNQSQRSLLLEILVKYYQIHTNNFKKPKSLQVLHELFS